MEADALIQLPGALLHPMGPQLETTFPMGLFWGSPPLGWHISRSVDQETDEQGMTGLWKSTNPKPMETWHNQQQLNGPSRQYRFLSPTEMYFRLSARGWWMAVIHHSSHLDANFILFIVHIQTGCKQTFSGISTIVPWRSTGEWKITFGAEPIVYAQVCAVHVVKKYIVKEAKPIYS